MNDLTSFPRADPGLVPNVPVKELYADRESDARQEAERLKGEKRWSLAESLFWIGTRSIDDMAKCLVRATYLDEATDVMVACITLEVGGRPAQELIEALKRNKVNAKGYHQDRGVRELIEADNWRYLEFAGPARFKGRVVASRPCRPSTPGNMFYHANSTWFDVDFDRVEIMTAFPVPVPSRPEFSDEQIKNAIRNLEENGKRKSQNDAWNMLKLQLPGVTQARLRDCYSALYPSAKQGPQPRANCVK